MEDKNKEKAWRLPDTITGWILLVFGVLAFLGGLMGIVGLSTFTLISVSAVSNGILHFIGTFKRWPIFPIMPFYQEFSWEQAYFGWLFRKSNRPIL